MLIILNDTLISRSSYSITLIRHRSLTSWRSLITIGIVPTLMLSWTMTSRSKSITSRQCWVGIRRDSSIFLTGCTVRTSQITTSLIWMRVMLLHSRTLVTLVNWRWCLTSDASITTSQGVISLKLTSVRMLLHALPKVIVGVSSLHSLQRGAFQKSLSWLVRSHGWTTWRCVLHGDSWVIRMR